MMTTAIPGLTLGETKCVRDLRYIRARNGGVTPMGAYHGYSIAKLKPHVEAVA